MQWSHVKTSEFERVQLLLFFVCEKKKNYNAVVSRQNIRIRLLLFLLLAVISILSDTTLFRKLFRSVFFSCEVPFCVTYIQNTAIIFKILSMKMILTWELIHQVPLKNLVVKKLHKNNLYINSSRVIVKQLNNNISQYDNKVLAVNILYHVLFFVFFWIVIA